MAMLDEELTKILTRARRAGRRNLLESEGLAVARALGISVPEHRLVCDAREGSRVDLDAFPGSRLVVKVASSRLLHKSDAGGVQVIEKNRDALTASIESMARRFDDIDGYLLCEWIEHDKSLGGELLLGLRSTPDFGPVVVLGPGGVDAEHLGRHLKPESSTAVFSPPFADDERIGKALAPNVVTKLVTEGGRGGKPRLPPALLHTLLKQALDFAATLMPHPIDEVEFNPLALTERGPVALDAVVRLAAEEPAPEPAPRPVDKLARLLRPRSVAVIGVSKRRNPGHVIVENLLDAGFPKELLYVVKPGADTIEGCRCFPDFDSLPERVDLAVLAIDAVQAPDVLETIVGGERAESVILIPGGLGETRGTAQRAGRLRAQLDAARKRGGGPVVNGGNCLGIRSVPGSYDTMFIPRHKLRYAACEPAPLAVLSQSGAFAVARASTLEALNPRYLVSLGNQLDLTVGDYLSYLKDEDGVEVFACYVEGFRPGDGRRFLKAAAEITSGGRSVVLYRAGRTSEGARASASHTASMAGDYVVTRQLAAAAGILVAPTLDDFEDMTRLLCRLRGRPIRGRRLGALSNAGFECVAVADNLAGFELAELSPATVQRIAELFEGHRLDGIVDVRNPLDVTPILGDEAFVAAARLLLEDGNVDVGVIGCVPLTGALQTLAAGPGHEEDVRSDTSVAERLGRLWQEVKKPWVAAVDAGPRYDAMARRLEELEVPVFRSIDRTVRALSRIRDTRDLG